MKTIFKVGDTVRVTATNEEMRKRNGYGGRFDKGDVAVVNTSNDNCFNEVLLGDETGAPCWIKDDMVELVETAMPVQPTYFKDMSDDEKGELLFARFNGTPYQLYNPLVGAWFDDTDPIDDDMSYRLKPQELIDAENRKKDLVAALHELEEELAAY